MKNISESEEVKKARERLEKTEYRTGNQLAFIFIFIICCEVLFLIFSIIDKVSKLNIPRNFMEIIPISLVVLFLLGHLVVSNFKK
jgi:hypothetical protein